MQESSSFLGARVRERERTANAVPLLSRIPNLRQEGVSPPSPFSIDEPRDADQSGESRALCGACTPFRNRYIYMGGTIH